jgi:hypothetical protein
MQSHPDLMPRTLSVGGVGCAELPVWAPDEEIAFAAELADLEAQDRERGAFYDADLDDLPAWDIDWVSDDNLVIALRGQVHEADLMVLASIDPRSLSSQRLRVDYVQAVDRAIARAVSLRHTAEVALVGETAGPEFLSEVHVEHELSVARHTSRHAAGAEIAVARRLATVFPGFAAALHDGQVSEAHCATLVAKTRHVTDPEVLAHIEHRVLPRARRTTTSQFGDEVAAAVADLDTDAAERCRKARATRGVSTRKLDDGMGRLSVTHDWATITAMAATTEHDARHLADQRGGAAAVSAGNADAGLDACRADALATRTLGAVHDDGSISWDRRDVEVTINVVIDLDTLRGEADHVALLEGQPIPGEIARELSDAAIWWRRMVTDPVDGHLLDYGRLTYLPARLRRYVLARDGRCRTPFCTDTRHLQMDHADEFPDGPSTTANCGTHSVLCHQLKTNGYADITNSRADGSYTWTTLWGHRIHVPPRSVLPHDPDPPAHDPARTTPEDQ